MTLSRSLPVARITCSFLEEVVQSIEPAFILKPEIRLEVGQLTDTKQSGNSALDFNCSAFRLVIEDQYNSILIASAPNNRYQLATVTVQSNSDFWCAEVSDRIVAAFESQKSWCDWLAKIPFFGLNILTSIAAVLAILLVPSIHSSKLAICLCGGTILLVFSTMYYRYFVLETMRLTVSIPHAREHGSRRRSLLD